MVFVSQPSLSQYTHDDVRLLGVPTSYDNDTAFQIANPMPNNDLDEDPQWRALGVGRLFRLQMEAFPFWEGTEITTQDHGSSNAFKGDWCIFYWHLPKVCSRCRLVSAK